VAPRLCADLHNAWQKGDMTTVARLNDRLMPLHDAMFIEASPGPAKYAAGLLGLCSDELRLPLCEIADSSKKAVRDALVSVGLLN
jgi:4-hydroxy-tetrahydrodipicolinate synthase